MYKKLLTLFLFIVFIQITKAQNEFITVWKPSVSQVFGPQVPVPYPSASNQIWLPVKGTNFQIYWEEIGYPTHNATLSNVNSSYQTIVDFGTSLNPVATNATYRLKISNGAGSIKYIRFIDSDLFPGGAGGVGDFTKIQKVEQWGNIQWESMREAFRGCKNLNIIATDLPNLTNVNDMSYMFAGCETMVYNSTINSWNISNVTTILGMFTGCHLFNQPIGNWNTSNITNMGSTFLTAWAFNQPLTNWDTSSVETMGSMFAHSRAFNQPIGNWNLSNVTSTNAMFQQAWAFNQPIGNWNVSNVTNMQAMFNLALVFNQDLSNWDVHHVINMQSMFNFAQSFNQNIGNWDTSSVENMALVFASATNFNQSLGKWNLSSLTFAESMLNYSGLSCKNYDYTLLGWSTNSNTPNNINISPVAPLFYSNDITVAARAKLITNKGWTINGDTYNPECETFLSTTENSVKNEISIYPNPASDFIYVKNLKGLNSYKIFDLSGRIILQNILNEEKIDVQSLSKGNYIVQIIAKEKTLNFKFIKR